jgi:hypothetical protein
VQEKPNAHIADVIEHIGKLIVPVVDKDRWRKRGYEKGESSSARAWIPLIRALL